jgi:hypothetical protein
MILTKAGLEGIEAFSRLQLRLVELPEHPRQEHASLPSELSPRFAKVDCGMPSSSTASSVRMQCLEEAREHISVGGLVILDDAWRHEYIDTSVIMRTFEHLRFVGLGPARWGVTRTDVYCAPGAPLD